MKEHSVNYRIMDIEQLRNLAKLPCSGYIANTEFSFTFFLKDFGYIANNMVSGLWKLNSSSFAATRL